MNQTYKKTNWILVSAGVVVCLLMRLIPIRPPNIEPVFATELPFAKVYGASVGFLFGILSILLYDIITGTLGPWTIVTSLTYGTIGLTAGYFFKKRDISRKNILLFTVGGTLFYDAITGLLVGPLLFHQPFIIALVGQIPFTILHLLGNALFALIVSPALATFLQSHKYTTRVRTQLSTPIIHSSL